MSQESVRVLFERLAGLPPGEREPLLADACAGDASLREEVEALLEADAEAGGETFWQHSAMHHHVQNGETARAAAGDLIGKYRLVELLGKGGMGAVYRAERVDAEFEKCVAVKLTDALFQTPDVVAHFRAERQILAGLEHPNIARLLDGGTRADGMPYLVMEFVEGLPPVEYCRAHGLGAAARLGLFRQICSAVHYAHQHMVIHRDLKPANILVTEEGTAKLLDFGIAKVFAPAGSAPAAGAEALTQPGMLKLTARYASPEQVRGEAVTTASDVYSLGVILYELLADRSPYGDADQPTHRIMHMVCEQELPRPSVWKPGLRGDLDNIVLKALRKTPGERYASADQFSEDILRHLDGRPVLARGDAPLYVAAKFVQRHRVSVVAAVLVLCSLVAGLVEVSLARARAERRFEDVRRLAHSVMYDYADAIDKLPGATPVRARLVGDALVYLDGLAREADTPQLQREVVDAYVHVSNVQGNEYENNLGDTAGALVSARKAAAEADKLLRQDRSAGALGAAASAFDAEGSLLYSAGDLEGAAPAYGRALQLYQQAAKAAPGDLENGIALSKCLRHMGDLYGGFGFKNLGKTGEGLAYYEQGKALAADLAARFPDARDVIKESYKTLISLSAAEFARGRRDDAARDLGQAVAQIEEVSAAEPKDVNTQVEQAVAESRLGVMLLDSRGGAEALPHVTRAAGLLETLLAADPRNTLYRRGLSVVESQRGAALRAVGQTAEAVPHCERSLEMAQALRKDSPGSAQFGVDVGISERKLAEALLAAGHAEEARQHAAAAVGGLCGSGGAGGDKANCGRAKLIEGNALLALHEVRPATADFRDAEAIGAAESQGDAGNAVFRSDWARAEAALAGALAAGGDPGGARAMYAAALRNWAALRSGGSLSVEDAQRAAAAEKLLAGLGGGERGLHQP